MNLLNLLQDQLGDQLSKHAGSFLGESQSGVSKALGGMMPGILGKMTDIAGTANGAKSIFDLAQGADDSILDNVGGLFGGGVDSVNKVLGNGGGMLNTLFGSGLGSTIDSLAGFSGLKKSSTSSLMKMAAPFLLGFVKRTIMKKGLDAVGLGKLLGSQKSHIASALPAGLGSSFGLGNLLSGISNTASNVKADVRESVAHTRDNVKTTTTTTTTNRNVETNKPGGGGFLKWIILGLLGLLLLGWLGTKGCNTGSKTVDKAAAATHNAAKKTVDVTANAAEKTVEVTGDALKGAANVITNAFKNVDEKAEKALATIKWEANSAGDKMMKFIKGGFKGNPIFRIKNGNFATASDALTPKIKRELDNVSSILKAYPDVKLAVNGYTDNTGDAAKNVDLSDRRAKSVKAYLISKGIAGNRVRTKGFGSANPVASNDTPEGRAENRRIELAVVK